MNNEVIILLIGLFSFFGPQRKETIYTKEHLNQKSFQELRIARNEIYAKHGYIFKSNELSDYFKQLEWYNPKFIKVDSLLSEIDKKNIELISSIESELKECIIPINNDLIEAYKKLNTNKEKNTSNFSTRLLKTIHQFKNKIADTTIATIKNIDGIDGVDTLFTRVKYWNGDINIRSSWTRNGEIVWSESILNPYLWISNNKEYDYDTQSRWVTFTVGIYHTIPVLKNIEHYSGVDYKSSAKKTNTWLGDANDFDEREYMKYLQNYRGFIISSGDSETSIESEIWYEPLKRFIKFYDH